MVSVAKRYLQAIPCALTLPGAWRLAGTGLGFREVAVLSRGKPPEILPLEAAAEMPDLQEAVSRIAARDDRLEGLVAADGRPAIMGIVNVTPDSFSDGGLYSDASAGIAHGMALADAGADILDIGGESTRPGATAVPPHEECKRVVPVIEGLRAAGCTLPISIDTRNALTAREAIAAGAVLLNDVSAMTHDPDMARIAPKAPWLCLMHSGGDPKTMQADPRYGDVLLDIYDYLEARLEAAEALGFARRAVLVDPGIGFGKTVPHNLALLNGLSLFHALGAPLLLGVSRKRFIHSLAGDLGGASVAANRAPGSIAAGLWGAAQGVHVLRVHDVAETAQALAVWRALGPSDPSET
ncbi:MAG: dihydropteroate synthase [Pseudomonadota bacterium]